VAGALQSALPWRTRIDPSPEPLLPINTISPYAEALGSSEGANVGSLCDITIPSFNSVAKTTSVSFTEVFGMTDDSVENILARDLERFVKNEAFFWGDNAAKIYFEPAEADMDIQWEWYRNF